MSFAAVSLQGETQPRLGSEGGSSRQQESVLTVNVQHLCAEGKLLQKSKVMAEGRGGRKNVHRSSLTSATLPTVLGIVNMKNPQVGTQNNISCAVAPFPPEASWSLTLALAERPPLIPVACAVLTARRV